MAVQAISVVFALTAFVFASASPVRAEDDELRLYGEPSSYTDVIDAFDEDDVFDFNIHVGFERNLTFGTVEREQPRADGRTSQNFQEIADYEQVRNTLALGLDVGIYRDLAVYARLPIVLSDTRTLRTPGSRSDADVAADLEVSGPAGTESLFSVPFTSPTRFGIDYLSVGGAYAIFNQYRDAHLPTWIIMLEGQFPIGEPMHACFDDKPNTATARCYGGDEPGIGQGLNGIKIETRASKRFRYIEPYGGVAGLFRWPGSSADKFEPGGELPGFVNTGPPQIVTLTTGMAVIPWEQKARAQRFTLDFRAKAEYVSEGRGYSPLFDALGTSQASALRQPTPECATCSAEVDFNGLTDMEAHTRLGGRVAIEMQAAKYVRFVLGADIAYATPYYVSNADSCNTDAAVDSSDPRAGACRDGVSNPHHRPAIDLPGRRFLMRGELAIDLFATAIAQF